jgi:hypothetical protein
MNIPASGELRLRCIGPGGEVGRQILVRFSPGRMAAYSTDTGICLVTGELSGIPSQWFVSLHPAPSAHAAWVQGKEAAVRHLQRLAWLVRSR